MIAAVPATRRRRSGHALPFAASAPLSVGTEIEVVLVHIADGQPAAASAEVLGLLDHEGVECPVKAELTQAMLEIASGVHEGVAGLRLEIGEAAETLQAHVARLGLAVAGGGAHPFSDWSEQVIFPTPRFRLIADTYGYLAKQFAVLSQHVHLGCGSGDEALYLTHALSYYVPHLIALTAASPYWRGIDTGFEYSRLNVVRAFPMSGHAPPLLRWRAFSRHVADLSEAGVIRSLKDLYWDIRPKPEYGTVEVRVCDSPLSVHEAADVVALLQTLGRALLHERAGPDLDPLYRYYDVNRFRAARYGLAADHVDTVLGRVLPLADSMLATIDGLAGHASALGTTASLERLRRRVVTRAGAAAWLRDTVRRERQAGPAMRRIAARWLDRAAAGRDS